MSMLTGPVRERMMFLNSGVPTGDGAYPGQLAYDYVGATLYYWNNLTSTWSTIGGGGPTPNLDQVCTVGSDAGLHTITWPAGWAGGPRISMRLPIFCSQPGISISNQSNLAPGITIVNETTGIIGEQIINRGLGTGLRINNEGFGTGLIVENLATAGGYAISILNGAPVFAGLYILCLNDTGAAVFIDRGRIQADAASPNRSFGIATIIPGAVSITVPNTLVTLSSIIFLTEQTCISGPRPIQATNLVAGVSFDIVIPAVLPNPLDVAYIIVN